MATFCVTPYSGRWSLVGTAIISLLAVPSGHAAREQEDALTLRLNIPAFRLDVREGASTLRSFRTAVGLRGYPTPTGDFAISAITWNPWWHPPAAGWAVHDSVTPPGPTNPVGKVKLQFDKLVFLHGTPVVASLGHAASHACVRLASADAIALARLLQIRAGAAITEAAMDSLLEAWHPTRDVTLTSPVRFKIVYEIVELRDSTLTLYPDIYHRERSGYAPLVTAALAGAGLDTTHLDRAALARAARRARASATSVRVHDLITRPDT